MDAHEARTRTSHVQPLRSRRVLKMIMHSTRDNMTIKMVLNNNCLIKMLIKLSFFVFLRHFCWLVPAENAGDRRDLLQNVNSIASHFVCARPMFIQFFFLFPSDRRRTPLASLTKTN